MTCGPQRSGLSPSVTLFTSSFLLISLPHFYHILKSAPIIKLSHVGTHKSRSKYTLSLQHHSSAAQWSVWPTELQEGLKTGLVTQAATEETVPLVKPSVNGTEMFCFGRTVHHSVTRCHICRVRWRLVPGASRRKKKKAQMNVEDSNSWLRKSREEKNKKGRYFSLLWQMVWQLDHTL